MAGVFRCAAFDAPADAVTATLKLFDETPVSDPSGSVRVPVTPRPARPGRIYVLTNTLLTPCPPGGTDRVASWRSPAGMIMKADVRWGGRKTSMASECDGGSVISHSGLLRLRHRC